MEIKMEIKMEMSLGHHKRKGKRMVWAIQLKTIPVPFQ